MSPTGPTPDVVAGWLGYGTDIDGAMAYWVALARGAATTDRLRSAGGWVDVDELGDEVAADELADRPVGAREACELFGWKLGTFHKWQQRRRTPAPDFDVNGAPAWWASTLRDWAWDCGREVAP